MQEYTTIKQQAAELGRERGEDAGSWVVDGNSSADTLRAVIQASDDGEFFNTIVPELSGPLSGEFADGWTPRDLASALDISEDREDFDDICSAFEDGYYEGFEAEAARSARAMLQGN